MSHAATPQAASPVISLESLLEESLQEVNLRKVVTEGRKALKDARTSQEDRDAINKIVHNWELTREWKTKADVVMFSRQKCNCCGNFSVQFLGYYQRQQSRVNVTGERWVKVEKPDAAGNLPRESKYQDSVAELCENCAEHAGFEVEE